jgi:hypothetical protein
VKIFTSLHRGPSSRLTEIVVIERFSLDEENAQAHLATVDLILPARCETIGAFAAGGLPAYGRTDTDPDSPTREHGAGARTDERFLRASEAFGRPRFYRLYRQWLKEGDGALDGVSSTLSSDALASGAGRVECLVLPHRYDHLSPVVDIMRSNPGNPIGDVRRPPVDVGGAIE